MTATVDCGTLLNHENIRKSPTMTTKRTATGAMLNSFGGGGVF
jgi:hypothetical protein